jgi:DNA-directed RNA polymerase subunit N (RpoN/RPB10)
MIIPIRCVTCGKVLADKWEYYVRKCKEQKDNETTMKEKFFFDQYTKEILDDLGLEKYCCRRHMIGHVDIIDHL